MDSSSERFECFCCGEPRSLTDTRFFEDNNRHGVGVIAVCLDDFEGVQVDYDLSQVTVVEYKNHE
jgi:imidazole glycerol phosphate synthase subunit HisF